MPWDPILVGGFGARYPPMLPPYTLYTRNSAQKKGRVDVPTLPCAMAFLRSVLGTHINISTAYPR
jgi:hypothetical protein